MVHLSAACPDPGVLDAAARGELSAADRRALEEHVDRCPGCGEVLAQLVQVYGSMLPSVASQSPQADPTVTGSFSSSPQVDGGSVPLGAVTLGRYRIGRPLGAGGMGVVYEAHDLQLQRRVALKLLHAHAGHDEGTARAQLLNEARAMARLSHPNVVTVHEVGEASGHVFVAMEFVEGGTLRQWMDQRKPRGPLQKRALRELLDTFGQAGRGLEAAHAVGLVHRDFKPDNALVGLDGRVRVVDFGLARPLDGLRTRLDPESGDAAGEHLTRSVARTRPGSLVGTPAYMSPEQLRGEAADARSDQFSFCITLYEALAGVRPFAGRTLPELATHVLGGRRAALPAHVPAFLREAIERGLSLRAEARHPSMTDLLRALRPPSRTWIPVAAAGAGVAAVGLLVGGWMLTRPSEPAAPVVVVPSKPGAPAAPEDEVRVPAEPTEGVCSAAGALHWTPQHQDAVRASLKRGLFETETAERTHAALSRWAQAFASGRSTACDDPQAAAQRSCLEESGAQFDALVGELSAADGGGARYAESAVARLPAVVRCGEVGRLARRPSLPLDARGLARRRMGRDAVARARAQLWLHRGDAVESAASAQTAAKAANDLVVEAEAQHVRGMALANKGAMSDAAVVLLDALELSIAAEHASEATAVSLDLIGVVGSGLRQREHVEGWERAVRADAESSADAALQANVERALARVALSLWELEEARAHLDAAVELDAKPSPHPTALAGDPLPLIESLLLLTEVELQGENPSVALKHALAAWEACERGLSPHDRTRGEVLSLRGRARLASGDAAGALADLDAALKLRVIPRQADVRGDTWVTRAGTARAEALAALGRQGEVLQAFIDTWHAWPARFASAESLQARGRWLIAQGEADEGLAALQKGLADAEAIAGEADDPRVFEAVLGLGWAQLKQGDVAGAEAAGERALQLANTHIDYGPMWGLAHELLGAVARAQGKLDAAQTHLDDVYVPLVSAYGLGHPHMVQSALDRADVAWERGKKPYAGRLYKASLDDLVAQRGAEHPDTVRARARAVEAP